MVTLSRELKQKYDDHYSDKTEKWRKIGAIGKVKNITGLTKGYSFDKVVEIGAGDGNLIKLLCEMDYCKELSAVEISSSAIEQMKKKQIDKLVEIKQFDGYNLPFADKQFDLAICSHVMEHVEHPRQLLNEIKRVSHFQLFEVPIDFSFQVDKKFQHFNAYGHINIYTPALFNFLLYSVGFEILKCKHALYAKEVIDFQFKRFSIKYFLEMIKRMIWKSVPWLMRFKPNTYTVLTR
jgi:ubiquinone/menaquinone biosynthesis C-methylase UbiE